MPDPEDDDAESYIGFNIRKSKKKDWKDWLDEHELHAGYTDLIITAVNQYIRRFDEDDFSQQASSPADAVEVDLDPVHERLDRLTLTVNELAEEIRELDTASGSVGGVDPSSEAILELMSDIEGLLPQAEDEESFIITMESPRPLTDDPAEQAQFTGDPSDILTALQQEGYDNLTESDVRTACARLAREDRIKSIVHKGTRHYVEIL